MSFSNPGIFGSQGTHLLSTPLADHPPVHVPDDYRIPISQLPLSAVLKSPNAKGGSVLDLTTLYPEDFGGLTALGTASDDTATMQALIDYTVTNGLQNVAIRLPPSLQPNSAPRHDRQGYAILALPRADALPQSLWFICAPGGTNITTTRDGDAYSALWGPPSVIGGPTPEQVGNGVFAPTQLHIIGELNVNLANANPTLSGVDLSCVNAIDIDSLNVDVPGDGSVQPTHVAFGVHAPMMFNGGRNYIRHLSTWQCYAGLVGASAHLHVGEAELTRQVIAFALDQRGTPDGHVAKFDRLLTQASTHHIGGWSPTTGAISLPNGTIGPPCIHAHWDIEDDAAPWGTTDHILDANNQITGLLFHGRAGSAGNALTVSGGGYLDLWDLVPQVANPTGKVFDGHGNLTVPGNLSAGFAVNAAGPFSFTNANGTRFASGAGAPGVPFGNNPRAGDYWFRTDTPTVANQRIYICTVGGGTPTWVGIV